MGLGLLSASVDAVEADVRRYPLPDGQPDEVVNKRQLAVAFNVSENSLDKWIQKPGFPILEGGANGVPYKFQLSQVWAWRKATSEQRRQEDLRVDAAVHQLRMTLLNAEPDSEAVRLSAKDRQEEYRAEAQFLATARARRSLVPTQDVLSLLERLFRVMSDGLDSQPDRIARELGLDGATTEKLVRLNDELIANMRALIEAEMLSERDEALF